MSQVLEGKIALVTGGTRGLGRSIAHGLAEAGATVVVSSRKADACEAVAAEIAEATGAKTLALPMHVGHWDSIAPTLTRVEESVGPLDVLVNNAGIAPLSPSLLEQSEGLYDKTMEVNLKGPFRLMAVAGDQMARSGGGSIINISSIGSQRPSAAEATYSAAKAGLNALTQAFAQEYAPHVRVNCVMPGAFATDMAAGWNEEFVDKVVGGLPAGRLGDPAELVGMIVHLASDASSYTTGAIIPIDGGRLSVY
ncbi:SDR family NAD(P)-dependent oxidoreductase [Gordonia humi]|uniref:NAD(P)-dependent dehydrogenase (Short-subunit alcohol dehydrogenase family) n=1 Tax=Gordonia humi TaxID=686429 RepID=A0A840EZ28_9ACTN|nr:glucose 1-dehydrogenase [Gordonia humi]MBB4134269.1 NAD(P)-dependent dehydrogenase (short-subunit alcohol dehydrogenase family) [Gordonia humi]